MVRVVRYSPVAPARSTVGIAEDELRRAQTITAKAGVKESFMTVMYDEDRWRQSLLVMLG